MMFINYFVMVIKSNLICYFMIIINFTYFKSYYQGHLMFDHTFIITFKNHQYQEDYCKIRILAFVKI